MIIRLICSAGMSTSLLVDKMRASAEEMELLVDIEAIAETQLHHELDKPLDVILIGPQIRYLERKIKQLVEHRDIKVDIIEGIAYGMMRGDKVLNQAIQLMNE